jgi:hypothetical protein
MIVMRAAAVRFGSDRRGELVADDRLEAIEALRPVANDTAAEIAEVLAMALLTVSRWLARIGLGKCSRPLLPSRPTARSPNGLAS